MEKKYQVFISSTRDDLLDARDAATRAILELGHIPVGMEMFSAADDDSWTLIKKQIDQSDYYIVIVAHRYGSLAPDAISYTEKEYDYACSKTLPVFGFLIERDAPWPESKRDGDPAKFSSLNAFKAKIQSKQVAFWWDNGTLQARVLATLSKQFTIHNRPGWIRGDQIAGPEAITELARLSRENAELRQKLDSADTLAEDRDALGSLKLSIAGQVMNEDSNQLLATKPRAHAGVCLKLDFQNTLAMMHSPFRCGWNGLIFGFIDHDKSLPEPIQLIVRVLSRAGSRDFRLIVSHVNA